MKKFKKFIKLIEKETTVNQDLAKVIEAMMSFFQLDYLTSLKYLVFCLESQIDKTEKQFKNELMKKGIYEN